ncbi:dihydrodipicolinate synthase family protein [Tepidamorphus sp. 3E244]|uniref:dihydrodipicolinate synthase family protein n=1 Tax=Tepidamorphus sp. 3E244 TaxID=3385498 RepID=UPI0038FD0020
MAALDWDTGTGMMMDMSASELHAQSRLSGIWASVHTPMTGDLDIDEAGLAANVEYAIEKLGIDGIQVCCRHGEGTALDKAERKRVAEIAAEVCDGRAGLTVWCADQNTSTVLDLAQHAQGVGADYVSISSPHLPLVANRCDALSAYYQHFDSQLDIGMIVWSHPEAGYVISPELCLELAELKNVVACEYAVHRPMYSALTKLSNGRLTVMNSSEEDWLDNIIELGWDCYGCSPEPVLLQTPQHTRMAEYTQLARQGAVEEARRVRDSMEPARRALWSSRPAAKPLAQQKYWLELMGLAGGPVRRPMLNLDDDERSRIRTAFDASGLAA